MVVAVRGKRGAEEERPISGRGGAAPMGTPGVRGGKVNSDNARLRFGLDSVRRRADG